MLELWYWIGVWFLSGELIFIFSLFAGSKKNQWCDFGTAQEVKELPEITECSVAVIELPQYYPIRIITQYRKHEEYYYISYIKIRPRVPKTYLTNLLYQLVQIFTQETHIFSGIMK